MQTIPYGSLFMTTCHTTLLGGVLFGTRESNHLNATVRWTVARRRLDDGDTLLMRLLLGIVRPKGGWLKLWVSDGKSVDVSPSTRSLFAYVPQGNTMFSGTVEENLRLIHPDATDEQLYEALRLACAEDLIRQQPLGLNTPIKEQGGGFSEGQLQRLCIARALLYLKNPVR